MATGFLSRFTPSMMSAEALEAIFVQREKLAQSLVDRLRDSVQTGSKHYMLLVGPRGIGKTHLVSLVYHRLVALEALRDQMRVAWLREEEWGITSYRDLLLRILKALHEAYPEDGLEERIEPLYGRDSEGARRGATEVLTDYVADRTLVVILENLDEVFKGLGEEGQQQWRAYLQNEGNTTVLATAQSLFGGVSERTAPFYGFFNVHHLPRFSINDAVALLRKVAEREGDTDLVAFLDSPTGRARVRAVHHLAGGNPRVYVIFSQFLTARALDQLVEPFLQMLDELTPYYQARMQWLSPQQRKIVEFLAERGGAVPVKTIAERNFMTPQTASGQLRSLREMGYVRSQQVGRESLYELQEPLLRLVVEVKKYRSGPIRLLVDFLRLWYTRTDLEQRMASLGPDATTERAHLQQALAAMQSETSSIVFESCRIDYDKHYRRGEYDKALEVAEEMVAVRGDAEDWLNKSFAEAELGRYTRATDSIEHASRLAPGDDNILHDLAVMYARTGRHEEAEPILEAALQVREQTLGEDHPHTLTTASNLANIFYLTGRYEKAEPLYRKVLEIRESLLGSNHPDTLTAKNNFGVFLQQLDHSVEAELLLRTALSARENVLDSNHPRIAQSKYNLADLLISVGRWHESLSTWSALLEYEEGNAEGEQRPRSLWLLNTLLKSNFSTAKVRKATMGVVELYASSEALEKLGVGLITNLSTLLEKPEAELQAWLAAWQEAAAQHEALEFPVRLFDAAVRYRASEDERVLLELPAEEREILRQVLGLEEAEAE